MLPIFAFLGVFYEENEDVLPCKALPFGEGGPLAVGEVLPLPTSLTLGHLPQRGRLSGVGFKVLLQKERK